MATPPMRQQGFSLVEALVALAIVASVVIGYIGIRTTALVDATQARNWRLAREIAEMKMSEVQAGAREVPPTSGEDVRLEDYEGWSFKIVIGESDVADLEAEIGAEAAGEDQVANERLDWQREREDYRRARSRGLSAQEYEEQLLEDSATRLAEKAPSATEFEEVAVAVYFPKLEPDYPGQKDALMIKARLSTLAISGMTPEQAQAIAQSKGEANPAGGAPTAPAAGEGR
jgi:prepilin-type N-terminal cleavage/methylation domain-containing protein